jgi:hypothetical protein
MAGINLGLVTGAVALLLTTPGHAQNDVAEPEDLDRCRAIADVMDRLACYDRIGKPETAPEPVPEAREEPMPEPEPVPAKQVSQDPDSATVATEETEYGELTDDVGLPKSPDDYKPIPVTVVRCNQASNRKWYFHLDNGQVWQYMGARNLRYRSCETPGKLIEDGLGFSLQMDIDTAKHRVKRVR